MTEGWGQFTPVTSGWPRCASEFSPPGFESTPSPRGAEPDRCVCSSHSGVFRLFIFGWKGEIALHPVSPPVQPCRKARVAIKAGLRQVSALLWQRGPKGLRNPSQLLQAHVLGLRPTGFVHILAGDSMCVCHGWSGRGPVGAADPGPLRRCQAVLCQSPTPVRVRGRCLRNTVANQIP